METIQDLFSEISNDNEEPVIRIVTRFQQEQRFACECRDCLLDITALALSLLKPRYSVSIMRRLHETEDDVRRFDAEVMQAVETAAAKVSAQPNHVR